MTVIIGSLLSYFKINTISLVYAQNADSSVLSETDESKLPITASDGDTNISGTNTVNNSPWVFVRMILALVIVVLLIYLLFRLLKKKNIVPESDENSIFLRKIASISLAPGKSVQVVSLIDHAYILGVGESSVSFIDEIKDKELINAMNLYADKNHKNTKPRNFSEVLDIFMPGKNKTEQNNDKVFDGTAQQILDSLEKQRDRINNGEDK